MCMYIYIYILYTYIYAIYIYLRAHTYVCNYMHMIYVTSHGPTSGRAATATGGTWSAQLSTARSVGSEELPLETQRHDVAMNGRNIWTKKHGDFIGVLGCEIDFRIPMEINITSHQLEL